MNNENSKKINNGKIIEVHDLTVAYRDIPVLWKINFEISSSTLTAVVGPNGAGKSTLVKTMMGLIKPVTGDIKIMGEPYHKIKDKHAKIAYIPQRESVDWSFPINVIDVVQMGRYRHLGWFKRPGKLEREFAMDALKKFEMHEFANHQIGELSGGQQQRVFLARAFVQGADLFFLDEPFGGVDAKTEEMTLQLLKDLRNIGKTLIVVTHDLQSLKEHFDHTILINKKLIGYGPTEEVLTHKNLIKTYGSHMHQVMR